MDVYEARFAWFQEQYEQEAVAKAVRANYRAEVAAYEDVFAGPVVKRADVAVAA